MNPDLTIYVSVGIGHSGCCLTGWLQLVSLYLFHPPSFQSSLLCDLLTFLEFSFKFIEVYIFFHSRILFCFPKILFNLFFKTSRIPF